MKNKNKKYIEYQPLIELRIRYYNYYVSRKLKISGE